MSNIAQASNILELNNYKTNNIRFLTTEFNKPLFANKFYINKEGLIYNSDIVKFTKNRWTQNPQLFAQDQYSEYEYYKIILLVNNIKSFLLFTSDYLPNGIIAPKTNVILNSLGI